MMNGQRSQDPVVLWAIIDAQAAQIIRLETLYQEASKDELTGLPKRAELMEATNNALSKGHLPTSMIFLDLNGFKNINDTIGHDAADSLLIQFAQFLREQREGLGDASVLVTIARLYRGDEFAILLTHTGAKDAIEFAMAIKEALKEHPFAVNGAKISLRSAIGVSTTGLGISTVGELLNHADKAMYQDKQEMSERGEVTEVMK
ncbi:MAG: GGDEF domain-containing protein [Candidatus Pacebacteria bacterium]|jgi:diguanylate cyclase (GGDEF)-like protein|nr:GGDEF domain-containing protein [Candidatus Paceibacterota bacterium]